MAEGSSCSRLLKSSNNPLVLTEFHIKFNNRAAFKILRQVNRVFSEYPKEYMQNSKTKAEITVPESRWFEVFGQDYETVISELAKVQIYRVETFKDGTILEAFQGNLLLSFSDDKTKFYPNEWVTNQLSYSFQFDRRVLTLMETHPEPAHVAIILESGIIERQAEL